MSIRPIDVIIICIIVVSIAALTLSIIAITSLSDDDPPSLEEGIFEQSQFSFEDKFEMRPLESFSAGIYQFVVNSGPTLNSNILVQIQFVDENKTVVAETPIFIFEAMTAITVSPIELTNDAVCSIVMIHINPPGELTVNSWALQIEPFEK
jgi:hypothetical protein